MRRLTLSLIVAAAILASIGLKLPGLLNVTENSAGRIPEELESLLQAHQFQVNRYVPDNDLTWISAVDGDCHVLVASVAPQGWHRALVAQLAAGNRLFYIFDGNVYPEQPIIRTRAYHYWQKFNRYLGLSPRNRAVLAAIVTPACRDLPLAQFAALSAR